MNHLSVNGVVIPCANKAQQKEILEAARKAGVAVKRISSNNGPSKRVKEAQKCEVAFKGIKWGRA